MSFEGVRPYSWKKKKAGRRYVLLLRRKARVGVRGQMHLVQQEVFSEMS